MTTGLIQEMIPVRMRELGIGSNYRTEMRTIIIPAGQTQIIPAYNTWVFIPFDYMGMSYGLVIESGAAITDLFLQAYNELGYEHTGKIVVINYDQKDVYFSFIQVIPQPPKRIN